VQSTGDGIFGLADAGTRNQWTDAQIRCVVALWKALWPQNRARPSRLQTAWSRCECESGFKFRL